MPLRRGEVRGFNFDRMVVEFTMLNHDKVVQCAISTAAMDDLEGKRDVKPDQRVDQFMRLREVIEEQASRKFFEELQPLALTWSSPQKDRLGYSCIHVHGRAQASGKKPQGGNRATND